MLNTFTELPGPLVEFPHRRELSNEIGSFYGEIKNALASALANCPYISLTLDLWSRPGYSSAMIGITLHFFDRKSESIKRALLACRTMKQPHTGEKIYELFLKIRDEWGLKDDQLLRIVTDNGSNVVKAFRNSLILLTEEEERELEPVQPFRADPNLDEEDSNDGDGAINDPKDGEDGINEAEFDVQEADIDRQFLRKRRISCIDHSMMLAVREGMDEEVEVKQAKRRAEDLVTRIMSSPKAVELLKERSGGLGLIKPIRTRWIYWFYVFERLLKLQRDVYDVCVDLNINCDLTPID